MANVTDSVDVKYYLTEIKIILGAVIAIIFNMLKQFGDVNLLFQL